MLKNDIRKARKSLGLSVKDFALLMGVSEKTQSRLEYQGASQKMFNILLWGFCRDPQGGVLMSLEFWANQEMLDYELFKDLIRIGRRFITDPAAYATWHEKMKTTSLAPKTIAPDMAVNVVVEERPRLQPPNGVYIHRIL